MALRSATQRDPGVIHPSQLRRWNSDFECCRPRNSGGWVFGTAVASSTWTGRAQRVQNVIEDDSNWDAVVFALGLVMVGVVIGMMLGFYVRRVIVPPHSLELLDVPQVKPSQSTSSGDKSPKPQVKHRESSSTAERHNESTEHQVASVAGAPELPTVMGDAKCAVPDVPVSSGVNDVIRRRRKSALRIYPEEKVIFTKTGNRFHFRTECDGLRNANVLRIREWRNCDQSLTPCLLCTGASSVHS